MAKSPHTRAEMRAFYPVCQVAELAARYRYTTTLAGLFQILATLRETPDPVAVLESLLADPALTALTPAAAGPFCLTSAAESDSSAVSQGGKFALLTGGTK